MELGGRAAHGREVPVRPRAAGHAKKEDGRGRSESRKNGWKEKRGTDSESGWRGIEHGEGQTRMVHRVKSQGLQHQCTSRQAHNESAGRAGEGARRRWKGKKAG